MRDRASTRVLLRRFGRCSLGGMAVEFALVLPVLALLLFGIVAYGAHLGAAHGVQQLAAEAARNSVGGLSDAERRRLVDTTMERSLGSYPFLDRAKVKVVSAALDDTGNVYSVRLNYDAGGLFIFRLGPFVPLPAEQIVRSAAIQRGGY